MGARFDPHRVTFEVGRRRVAALHGDGLAEPRLRARLLHRAINHPITARVYHAIHPEIGLRVVDWLSPRLGDHTADAARLAQAAERQREWAARLLAAEPKGRAPPADRAAPELMAAQDVKVWFPIRRGLLRRVKGYIKAVDGVSLAVRTGTTLGVVGESGSGKTTLGLALLRLTEAEGKIRFAAQDIAIEFTNPVLF